jgi:hypothetical protein
VSIRQEWRIYFSFTCGTHLEVVRAGQQLGAGGDAVDLLRVLLPRILARQLAELQ